MTSREDGKKFSGAQCRGLQHLLKSESGRGEAIKENATQPRRLKQSDTDNETPPLVQTHHKNIFTNNTSAKAIPAMAISSPVMICVSA